jgi:hypothetical protein
MGIFIFGYEGSTVSKTPKVKITPPLFRFLQITEALPHACTRFARVVANQA